MISIYLSIAIAVGVGAFAVADGLNQRHGSGCDHPGWCAVIAGILWPVLAIGLVQILLVTVTIRLASVMKRGATKSRVFASTRR